MDSGAWTNVLKQAHSAPTQCIYSMWCSEFSAYARWLRLAFHPQGNHRWRRCQSSVGCCLCAAGFPLAHPFGRRSMTVWMCADMLTVLLHQLFGKGEVKATPASCFQRGVLCVYPQATIKASRETRFNHMHHSCPTETHCSKPETLWYQKSCPKLDRLITKAWGSMWPDCDPCNYSLCWACRSSPCLRPLQKALSCEWAACGDRLINRTVVDGAHTLGKCPVSADVSVWLWWELHRHVLPPVGTIRECRRWALAFRWTSA